MVIVCPAISIYRIIIYEDLSLKINEIKLYKYKQVRTLDGRASIV